MMKTSEEIKKGLADKLGVRLADNCNYELDVYAVLRIQNLHVASLTYIQQLEADNSRLSDTIRSLTDLLNAAHEETAKVKRERDAAVRGLHGDCETCKHYETENCAYCVHDPDAWSAHEDNWEWEGVGPENTEVQDGK